MTLNYECVRDLILWIEANQGVEKHGKPKPIRMKDLYEELTYSREDLHTAALYLVEKKILKLQDGVTLSKTTPMAFVFCGISGIGYDYIAAIKDDTVWKKVKNALGSVALASVPNVIEIATKFIGLT